MSEEALSFTGSWANLGVSLLHAVPPTLSYREDGTSLAYHKVDTLHVLEACVKRKAPCQMCVEGGLD